MMFLLIEVRSQQPREAVTIEEMSRLCHSGDYRLPTPYEQEQHTRDKRKQSLLTE